MSSDFLTVSVSRLLGMALVSWASARVGVHSPEPFPFRLPYLGVFSFTLLRLPLSVFRVSSLRLTYLHPFGRPFMYSFLGEFVLVWHWLWYPLLWSQRRSRGAQEIEI